MPNKLRQVIEFDTIADAISADVAWQDNDKVMVGTGASKMWYDFEATTALPTNGTSVVAVSGGYLIMQGAATAGNSGSEWIVDSSNTGTGTTEVSGSYTVGSMRRNGSVSISNTSSAGFNIYNYDTTGEYKAKMYSGSSSAPTQYAGYNGAALSGLTVYDGTSASQQAALICHSAGVWSATSKPTQWRLSTTPVNSTTPWNMLYASSEGNLGVGKYSSNAATTIDVQGSHSFRMVETSAATYVIAADDSTVLLNSAVSQSVTLPPATAYPGRIITVVNQYNTEKVLTSYYNNFGTLGSIIPKRSVVVVQAVSGVWRQINNQAPTATSWATTLAAAGAVLNVDNIFYVYAAATTYTLSISAISAARPIHYKSHAITGATSVVQASSTAFTSVTAPLYPSALAIASAPGTSSQIVWSLVVDATTWAVYEISYVRATATAVHIKVTKIITP